jgi:carboxypeptidase Taq
MAKSGPKSKNYPEPYVQLRSHLKKASVLGSIGSLLGWDQETYMPAAAAEFRAEQHAEIASLTHERKTDKRIGELLSVCEDDESLMGDEMVRANLREIRRDFELATKVPGDLVAELARVGSQSQEAWKDARAKGDFKAFRPWLEKMVALKRREAECLGRPAGGELYDALLDQYEPGMSAREIQEIFTPLRERLSGLIARVAASKEKVSVKPLSAKIPAEKQHAFGQFVLASMGFDLQAGRLDTTTHPFCSGMAPGDTRLTTRYRDEKFTDALYGTMHEMGHGLYEQGLPKDQFPGEPLADAISLGIHESQSRMWENFVGRSLEFWRWALPKGKKYFGPALSAYDAKAMYRAVNTCSPSFIRVEADEGTYNLHVMLRFELERALFSGDLAVKDLPEAWNEKFKSMFGLEVPDDRRGCLQDVHWSFGLMGYFPTYTLGNLYAAQFWEKINKDLPELPKMIAKGEFLPLREWLLKNIHRHGRRYRAAELCKRVTGRTLSADPLMRHLEGKLGPIYNLG